MNPVPIAPVLRKILVVDDNPIIQRSVYFALRDQGFLVLMAGSISDAFNLIRCQKPVLILLDLNFPVEVGDFGGSSWDGFTAIEWLRRRGDFADIPIIVISSNDPEEFRPRALAAGAQQFLPKPFAREELQAAVLDLLGPRPTPSRSF